MQPQSLQILTRKEVESLTSLSRSSIYQLVAQRAFPQAIRLLPTKSVGWNKDEVESWIRDRMNARRGQGSVHG